MSGSIRQRAETQRKLVAILALEIRKVQGPSLPDEIALPLTALRKSADDTITDLNNAALVEWFPEGWCLMSDRHPRDTHLVIHDPLPAASGSND